MLQDLIKKSLRTEDHLHSNSSTKERGLSSRIKLPPKQGRSRHGKEKIE